MTIKEIVKEIMSNKGVLQKDLAGRLNLQQATISERLKRKNISTDTLRVMLNALDYKIVIVPRSRRVGEDEFELTDTDVKSDTSLTKANLELLEKTKKEDATYDLWLKKVGMSVEEYTNKLADIWKDDNKRYNKEFEKYIKWFTEEKMKG